jgi:uncharacterized protein YbjT (DUF2867 family)
MSNEILVLGGTGKTGKRIASRLQKLNLPVRIGSRNSEHKFDWNDSRTWSSALTGVEKVYISFQPDLAVPGALNCIEQFVKLAQSSAVKKLVLLSGRGEKEAELCEQVVINSGIDYTIVRASWFMQNFSEGFFLDSILAGHVVLPATNVLEPFVDVEDIADVATAALTSHVHRNKIYELTGPTLMSFEAAVTEISLALNRTITYQEVSMEEYISMLKTYEVPDDFIWLIQYLFTEVLDGRNESLTNGVEDALGRRPGDFSEYTKAVVQSGTWSSQQPEMYKMDSTQLAAT